MWRLWRSWRGGRRSIYGLRREGFTTHTVIQESAVRYDAPIHGTFRAISERVVDEPWERFTRAIARRGKGRLALTVRVEADGVVVASFRGSYVALARPGA